MVHMLEHIILGAVQGVAEWLPISSEGMIVLVKANFFGGGEIGALVREALWLHLGTFFAALVYFRRDVAALARAVFSYAQGSTEEKKLLQFLLVSTGISGALGFLLLEGVAEAFGQASAAAVTGGIGVLLLVTGGLQAKAERQKTALRGTADLRLSDSVLLGVVQALAVLPGLSRSGFTVSALLLRRIRDTEALRLSFLMSLPIVLAGNIFLNAKELTSLNNASLAGLFASFVFGLATIHALLAFARRVRFSIFVIAFGLLMILAAFVV